MSAAVCLDGDLRGDVSAQCAPIGYSRGAHQLGVEQLLQPCDPVERAQERVLGEALGHAHLLDTFNTPLYSTPMIPYSRSIPPSHYS